MSLSAFLQAIVAPTRWWRRQRTIQVTIWPKWLAQALCPHLKTQLVMGDVKKKTKTSVCFDCYKHITESNDCVHSEVQVWVVETVGNALIPRTFRCQHCGMALEACDLPPGVVIYNSNDSAARDH
jgi:hypothetical protein